MFDTRNDAEAAVSELQAHGFTNENISLVANNATGEYGAVRAGGTAGEAAADATESVGAGAMAGAGVGAGIGLLVGLGLLVIPGIGPVLAAGPIATAIGSIALGAGIGAVSGGIVGPLVDVGVPHAEAEVYSESVRRGSTLVMVATADDIADDAADIMGRHSVADVDEREGSFRQSGWQGATPEAKPYTAAELAAMRAATPVKQTAAPVAKTDTNVVAAKQPVGQFNTSGDTVLPVIEEQMSVGTRQVERGRARVHTQVTETPVEEQVKLREERVNVERRPVDRAVTDADMAAMKDSSFEMTTMGEEAVVAKTARVIEEVVVGKQVTERTETVRDTVRRTDVDVQQDASTAPRAGAAKVAGYDTYDTDFRSYYTKNLGKSGYSYEEYAPVFRYGHDLSTNETYRGRAWKDIEGDARTSWEAKNPGTWEQFKDSVQYAWGKATGQR